MLPSRYLGGWLKNSYSTGHIAGGYFLATGGGTDSYFDYEAAGRDNCHSNFCKTTRELQRPTGPSGIYANWDPDVWDFGTSRQYPVLKQTPGGPARQR